MLADTYGVPASGGTVIEHRMSQSDIATLVGAFRQWTNGTLGRFQDMGLVSLEGPMLEIIDVESLRSLSDDGI